MSNVKKWTPLTQLISSNGLSRIKIHTVFKKTKKQSSMGVRQLEGIKNRLLQCYHCGNKSSMEVVGRKDYRYDDFDWGYDGKKHVVFTANTTWEMLYCPVCNQITLYQQYTNSEEFGFMGESDYQGSILYPIVKHPDVSIPSNVRKAFESALKVKNVDQAICLIALRRTLDFICKDQLAEGKDLYNKLKFLSNRGTLPPIVDDMATSLRVLGNSAAHGDDVDFIDTDINLMEEFTSSF